MPNYDKDETLVLKILAVFLAVAWVLALTGLFILYEMRTASAHDAPSGWQYSSICCNTTDCRPVEAHSTGIKVVEVIDGWKITRPSGKQEIVTRGDSRLRESKDEHYHICTTVGDEESTLLCLYVPFRGI